MEQRFDTWEESLRRTVAGHEAEPPAAGWEDMERRLASAGLAGGASVRRRAAWRKSVAAGVTLSAAACAALVALLAPPSGDGGAGTPSVTREVAAAAKKSGLETPDGGHRAPLSGRDGEDTHTVQPKTLAARTAATATAAIAAPASGSTAALGTSALGDARDTANGNAGNVANDANGDAADKESAAPARPAGKEADGAPRVFSETRTPPHAGSHTLKKSAAKTSARRFAPQFSLGMNAVSPTGTQRENGFNMTALRSTSAEEEAGVAGLLSASFAERNVRTEISYGMPVQIGLGVGLPLTRRWRVNTGLIYTRLSADIRSGSDDVYSQTKQRVYYIGVPVQAAYTFFASRVADLYATAGVTVEKAVKAHSERVYHRADGTVSPAEEDANATARGLWQFSTNLSAGVQLNATPWLGVYCEPGVAYYFNDGSEMPSVRHEHPWYFNLQAGLRFTIH